MNYGGKLPNDIDGFIRLFVPHCHDSETLDQLHRMLGNRGTWAKAHDLFNQIRNKTLKAERAKDHILICQYMFEEICAKTLYNLSGKSAPFDADSPYWIIPNAISFARAVGVADTEVIKVVAA
ncbi:MAG TPA: hypothetical protein VF928_07615 [Usitatibacteraceae bacterium]